jgi:hypothetical protein
MEIRNLVVANVIPTSMLPGLGPCSGRMLTWYKLLLAFTFIASNFGNSRSSRAMKSASFRFSFGVHNTSAKRQHTRHGHVFHVLGGEDVLGPHIALRTQDVLVLLGLQFGGNGLVAVDLLHRGIPANGQRFVRGIALVVVEVAMAAGAHHRIMPAACRAIPPSMPCQLITAALGARPPSRISSQPMIFRPFAFTNFSMRWMK